MTDPTVEDTIEPAWLIEATCAPDAAETRVPFRARHMARSDIYMANGVWVELRARPFGHVVRSGAGGS